jgi:hypothetical protein
LVTLATPALRGYGIQIAVGFHALVAASPVVAVEDFSLVVFASAMLFLSNSEAVLIQDRAQRLFARSRIARDLSKVHPSFLRILLGLGVVSTCYLVAPVVLAATIWLVGLATGLTLMFLLRQRPITIPDRLMPRSAHPGILVLLLALIVVSSPYFGLRTTGVFTMFSNLRTEGPGTNHLFMPSFHPTDHQTALVEVLDPWGEVEKGWSVPTIEVYRSLASDESALSLVGSVDGEPLDPTSIAPFSRWELKLLNFRPIDLGQPACAN